MLRRFKVSVLFIVSFLLILSTTIFSGQSLYKRFPDNIVQTPPSLLKQ